MMPDRASKSARHTRNRIPNKVMWNLEDIIAIFADDVPDELSAILQWLEVERAEANLKFDTRRKIALGRLSHVVAKLQQDLMRAERKVRDARNGEYRERGIEEDD